MRCKCRDRGVVEVPKRSIGDPVRNFGDEIRYLRERAATAYVHEIAPSRVLSTVRTDCCEWWAPDNISILQIIIQDEPTD